MSKILPLPELDLKESLIPDYNLCLSESELVGLDFLGILEKISLFLHWVLGSNTPCMLAQMVFQKTICQQIQM